MSTTLLPNWLTRCAENTPQHIAVTCGEVSWTFSQLEAQAARLAQQLATVGVEAGTRVALLAANGLPFVACVHALTRLQAILIPLNTRLTHDELQWQLEDVQAAFLLSDQQHAERAGALVMSGRDRINPVPTEAVDQQYAEQAGVLAADVGRDRINPVPTRHYVLQQQHDTITILPPVSVSHENIEPPLIDLSRTQIIMYTSGTTGKPKGVIITYGMQWWNAIGSALNLGQTTNDCWLACLPLFHIGGLSILIRSVIYGMSIIVHEKFDAPAVNRAIEEQGVTIVSVVSAMLQRMLNERQNRRYPETLRCLLLGGGPVPLPLLEVCAQREIPVVQTYGMTESCSQAVTLAPHDALRKVGSAGRPLLPVQIKIQHDDRIATAGEPGTILLQGPTITPGYAGRAEETGKAILDGWLVTGDIGYLDEEGYLYVLDRRSDLIISGGENVYPAEIEAVLQGHPAVLEAGVTGRPDEEWGQVPVAFVHLQAGSKIEIASMIEYLSKRLARYKLPREIHIVGDLPRNAAGKLMRRELLGLLGE